MQAAIKDIVTEIQSLGIRVPEGILGRSGGAGPAEGRAFLIGGVAVNAPIRSAYAPRSPYALDNAVEGGYVLLKNGQPVAPVSVVPEPRFYDRSDARGVAYRKIALRHGTDCLATTVLQRCIHWRTSGRCAFCATEISLARGTTIAKKTPAQLAEVARFAAAQDGVRHVVLTSGTAGPPGSEIGYLAQCAAAIKSASGLPVHVQFLPPEDLALIDALKDAGVDTAGIHVESFDPETLWRVAPAKARVGMKRYTAAWKRAVEVFGPNQVSSFLIAGLGEPPATIVSGSEILADLGVYPFVVPLRPIPGSWMENALPPPASRMQAIYTAVARVLRHKGLSASACVAGCVRCGACSALPLYEKTVGPFLFHSARNQEECRQAFAIRQAVFVEEQGIFSGSDRDENDATSIHLVAEKDRKLIGTVRVFPDPQSGNGHWIGGRLAVLKDFRIYRVGAGLVKEAMKRVKKNGCTVFTAHIQEQNVRFFQKLGWKAIGAPEMFCGRRHRLMQADLTRVPEDFDPPAP